MQVRLWEALDTDSSWISPRRAAAFTNSSWYQSKMRKWYVESKRTIIACAMEMSEQWLQHAPKARPLGKGEKWNVFLSYRSVNRIWVLNLYDVLHHQGFDVFLDQVVLAGGNELIRVLEDGLQQSQAGVLVWSSQAGDSDWVRREYQTLERQALDRKEFCFIPVRLDNSKLPPFAENRVFLDFSAYPDGPNGGELLRLLHAITGKPLTPEAAHFAAEQDELAKKEGEEVGAAIRNKDPELLMELFNKGGLAWQTSSALGCKTAEGLIKLGRNDDAIRMLDQLSERFPQAIRPQQLHALALARRGTGDDLRQAQRILGTVYEAGERDPETLGIYARTWMDRYSKSADRSDLEQSRDLYAEAFERARDDYYTGVNAASKSVLLGTPEDLTRGSDYAARVQLIVGTEAHPGDYWMTATVGEVFLLMRKYEDAARLYRAAVSMARSERASHESTWQQACRLMEMLQPSAEERSLIRAAFAHLPDCA
jgi:tetratricopeptide (TPR) repeat protein